MDRLPSKSIKDVGPSDSKRLRTLKHINQQKKRRQDAFNQNRVLETPGSSEPEHKVHRSTPSTSKAPQPMKKFTKAQREERGRERYTDLLKWKEKRAKIKALIGRHKDPVFHTGVYQPGKAKFLQSDPNEEPAESANLTTTWKGVNTPATARKSTLRSRAVPQSLLKGTLASQAKISKTPAQASRNPFPKSLQFRTGLTPSVGGKPNFYKTPKVSSKTSMASTSNTGNKHIPKKSFAPANYQFNVPKGISGFNFNTKTIVKQKDETPKMGKIRKQSPRLSAKQLENAVNSTEFKTSSENIALDAHAENTIDEQQLDVTPKMAAADSETSITDEEEFHIDAPPDVDTGIVSPDLNASHVVTPVKHRKSSKRQTRAMFVTPPTAKLRARTPCSRSTKHSRSVHCNRLSLGSCQTPKSTKKTRKSVKKENSPKFEKDTLPETPILKNKRKTVKLQDSPELEKEAASTETPILKNKRKSMTIPKSPQLEKENALPKAPIPKNKRKSVKIQDSLELGEHSIYPKTPMLKAKRKSSVGILSPINSHKSSPSIQIVPATPDLFADSPYRENTLMKKHPMSSLRKKRLAKKDTPLEKMFLEIPMDSPIPFSLPTEAEASGTCSANDTLSEAEVDMLVLLQKTSTKNLSPKIQVWDGEEEASFSHEQSEASNVVSAPRKIWTSPKSILKKKTRASKLNVSFVGGTRTPSGMVATFPPTPLPGRRKSRSRLSISVDDLASPGAPCVEVPRPSLLPGMISPTGANSQKMPAPKGDLMSFETPPSNRDPKHAKPQSRRVSLMADLVKAETEDLMTFQTPIAKKSKRKSMASNTPLRRSMRLKTQD